MSQDTSQPTAAPGRPARPTPTDYATDWDHTHEDYAAAAPEIWDDLREPLPGGPHRPLRRRLAAHPPRGRGRHRPRHHPLHLAERRRLGLPALRPGAGGLRPAHHLGPAVPRVRPPLLLPAFSPKAIRPLEASTRELCAGLLDDLLADGATEVDAATAYAQHIPVRVIAHMLGVPPEDGDRFRGFIHRILEKPGQTGPVDEEETMVFYLEQVLQEHREASPATTSSATCSSQEVDGEPLEPTTTSSAPSPCCSSPASTPPGRPSAPASGTWPSTRTSASAWRSRSPS